MQRPSTTLVLKPLSSIPLIFFLIPLREKFLTPKHHSSSASPSSNCQEKQHSPNNCHSPCWTHSSDIHCQSIQQETWLKRSAHAFHVEAPTIQRHLTWGAVPPSLPFLLLRVSSENSESRNLGLIFQVALCFPLQEYRFAHEHDILEVTCTQANSKQVLGTKHWRALSDKLLPTFFCCSCWETPATEFRF